MEMSRQRYQARRRRPPQQRSGYCGDFAYRPGHLCEKGTWYIDFLGNVEVKVLYGVDVKTVN